MKQKKKRVKNPRIRSDGYAKDVVYSLEIDRIRANAAQPRKDFEIESIIKLADSIRRYGILQPLTVRRVPKESEPNPRERNRRKRNLVEDVLSAVSEQELADARTKEQRESPWDGIYVSRETSETGALQLRIPDTVPVIGSTFEEWHKKSVEKGELCAASSENAASTKRTGDSTPAPSVFVPTDTWQYELVAGERRLRAAKMLGMREVPCIIVDANDALSAELALVENMLRENLNMFEQAEAFARLSQQYSLTQEEIASKMSLSQSAVANKIRLLKLDAHERQQIIEAALTERHARAFLRISDPKTRENCIQTVIEKRMNVNDTDKYITAILERTSATKEEQAVEVLPPSPDKLCANIYKFISRMQSASGNYLIVNRRSDDKNVVITLTVRKGS